MYKVSWLVLVSLSIQYAQAILVKVDVLKSPRNQLVYLYSDFHDFSNPELLYSQLQNFVQALATHEQESSDTLVVLVEKIALLLKRRLKDPCITNRLEEEIQEKNLSNTLYEDIEVRNVLMLAYLLFNPQVTYTGTHETIETYTFRALFEEIELYTNKCTPLGLKHARDMGLINYYIELLSELIEQNNFNLDCSLLKTAQELQLAGKKSIVAELYKLITDIGVCFFDIMLYEKIQNHPEDKIVVVAGSGHVLMVKQKLLRDNYILVYQGGSENHLDAAPEPLDLGPGEFREKKIIKKTECLIV
ncbi:hypothetical protein H0X48_00760 [Candidatus Dependentiae bacterium]|nr:hypothetical protein [Candidatus Dependentiae bacterium]